jgi:ribose transport system ATP-binding protein
MKHTRKHLSSHASLLEVRGLNKAFRGIPVLQEAALDVEPGRVQALLGHNGSGKSTLIKILAGYYTPDDYSGLLINGADARFPLSGGDHGLHLGFVHQDLGLIPSLSVVDNLELGLSAGSRWFDSWKSRRLRAEHVLGDLKIDVDVRNLVGALSPEDQAAVAIARAMQRLSADGKSALLVLDEVTAFLPRERREILYEIISNLAESGCGVLFVSHDIDEVMEICDTVTVLRNGRVVGSAETDRATTAEIIEMIIGHRLTQTDRAARLSEGRPVSVKVRGLTGQVVKDLSFDARQGEILGVTGVLGSGFDEVPRLLYGATPAISGELVVEGLGLVLQSTNPRRSLAAGVRLVPAARLAEGLIGDMPLTDNVTLPSLRAFAGRLGVWLSRRKMIAACRDLLREFGVTPLDPHRDVRQLSGGNQQKALLAKTLNGSPRLVLLHEPTQGVDVGAREQIFRLIGRVAERGATVVVASSDHAQLAALCERIVVIRDGVLVRELTGSAVTKKAITAAAYEVAGSGQGA